MYYPYMDTFINNSKRDIDGDSALCLAQHNETYTSKALKCSMPMFRGRKGKVAEIETTQNGLKSHSGHRACHW